MAEKQALNATFFAFQKRDKMVLAPATVTTLVLLIVLIGGFFWMARDAIGDYFRWAMTIGQESAMKPGEPPSPEMMMPPASVMNLGGVYFLFIFVQYVLFAAYEAACLRWMIRGETGGLMGLTLGADTWRVYFSYWLWFILLVIAYILAFIVALATGASIFGSMAAQKDSAAAAGPSVLIFIVICLAIVAAFIYVAVRFAPAAATSIAEKRFAFFDAWKVTKGRFWGLLGAYVLLYLMFIVGYFIVAFALGMIMATTMMGHMGAIEAGGAKPSPEQVLSLLTTPGFLVPIAIFYLVVLAAVMTFIVALYGVNARAAKLALEEGKISAAA